MSNMLGLIRSQTVTVKPFIVESVRFCSHLFTHFSLSNCCI